MTATGGAVAGVATEKPPPLGEVTSAATFAVVIITAWLYTTGWTYAYQYLGRFRIPLLMADLPPQHYVVYGWLVIWKNLPLAIVGAALILGFAWALVRWAGRLGRFWISAAVVLLIATLFPLGRAAGIAAARTDFLAGRDADYPAYPRTALVLKKEAAEAIGDRLADVLRTDCGRLVLVSGGRLFLIRPIRDAPGADLDAFVLATEQVAALRITGDYRSCP
jgi:hypothetical protein